MYVIELDCLRKATFSLFAVVLTIASAAGQSAITAHPGIVYGKRAQNLMSERRNAEALPEWEAALRLEPRNPVYHNLFGLALQSTGKAKDGRQEFRRAVQLYPAYFDAQTNLAYSLMADGQLKEASSEFERALSLRPLDSELHLALGVVKTSEADTSGACRQFESARKWPKSPELLWSIFATCLGADHVETAVKAATGLPGESNAQLVVGQSLLKAHEAKRALPFLLRAKKQTSPTLDAALALAEAYLETEEPGLALDTLDAVSEEDRDRFAVVEIRASALLKLGQRAKAKDEFEKLVKLYPDQPDAYIDATQIPLENQNWDEVLDLLNTGLTRLPQNWLLLLRRAIAFKMMGRLDEARADLLDAVQSGGEIGLVMAALGDTTAARGDLPGAADLFRKAFHETNRPEFQLAYALVIERQGDNVQALREMSKAVELLPISVRARYEYGKLLARSGRVREAKLEFEHVRQLDPTYSPNLYALSRVYAEIGKPELASEMAREFIASKDKAK